MRRQPRLRPGRDGGLRPGGDGGRGGGEGDRPCPRSLPVWGGGGGAWGNWIGNGNGNGNGTVQPLTLVRPWVHHVLVEVVKNAAASSVQRAQQEEEEEGGGRGLLPGGASSPPEVHVRLLDGPDSALVVVMDQGVGLSQDRTSVAFGFAQSTSQARWDRIEEQTSYAAVRQPLGSLGVGLPLSRMMARWFGGDLRVADRPEGGGAGAGAGDARLRSGCTAAVLLPRDDALLEGAEGAPWGELY